MPLVERYKQARLLAGYSQAEMAKLTKSTQSTISSIEKGRIVAPRNLETHAIILGISESYLLLGPQQEALTKNNYSPQYKALSQNLEDLEKKGMLDEDAFQIIYNAISIANIHHRRMTTNK